MSTKEFSRFPRQETEQTIPQRFSLQVARYPDASAVITASRSISYRELDELSNQVANAVVHHSLRGSNTVLTVFDQGADSIIAILGVLKAGKTFVSLNPAATPMESRRIVTDCDPELVLVSRIHKSDWEGAGLTSAEILSPEETAGFTDRQPDKIQLSPSDPAYIFYTSGSTGAPKGVVDCHRNVLHNVMRYTNSLDISPADRLSLIQAPNFSGTVSSLLGALLNGAAICPYNLRQQGTDGLAAWMNDTGITIYHSVPIIFRSFLRGDVQFPSVRLIRLEGDRASLPDVELYQQYFSPTCILVNGLGTTETGLCRQYFINKESEIADSILPIGYPVADMDILLFDAAGQEVAINQTGEIAVKSRYLSLGYWQKPELTQASFLQDPKGGAARIYRTGDMGRLRPDGCLEYLGRKNSHLKIRGQRVEPAEVEKALLGLDLIREAAVITREDRRGEAQLVAYLDCYPEAEPPAAEIRRLLRQHLPDALIPTAYVFLKTLPVTVDGKIDRRNLPDPEAMQPILANTYIAPRTAVEQIIAGVWAEVFALDRVGLNDDFLALGGDSIMAMQIISRLRKHLDGELSFSTLFNNSRLLDLANQIEQKPGES